MTDHQDQAQHDQLDLVEQIKRESDGFKPVRDVYAIFSDALKMVGAGNAARVVAAAAALTNFSEHTILIKIAGASFYLESFVMRSASFYSSLGSLQQHDYLARYGGEKPWNS